MGYTTDFRGLFELNRLADDPLVVALHDLYKAKPRKHGANPEGYCQWILSKDRMGIEWDKQEKFYDYVVWLKYIIDEHLAPNGYKLTGSVLWRGEDIEDVGVISVLESEITVKKWDR